ncbi:MAG TPA: VTT domain-containing protein [Alphaproteobacteria bacterium]|nr:VTT domain-containing protein [Alphaproteobacteria bacterium]
MYTHTQLVIFDLIFRYSYLIIFPLVVFEGPIVTIIAGFLVATGFLDFIPAYLTIVTADLMGDVLYYSAGRWWLKSVTDKIFSFFKISIKKVKKFETALKNNQGKVLFFGKLSHALGAGILFAAGSAKVPFNEFLGFNLLATLPKSLILLGVGYYFGSTVSNFGKYLNITLIALFIFTVVLLSLYFLITQLASKFVARLEK